jgi:amidase
MRLFVTSLLAEEPWKYDSKVIPIPWRQSEEDIVKAKLLSGGLTLAYYSCNGVVSIPGVSRTFL